MELLPFGEASRRLRVTGRRAGLPQLYVSWHSTDADLFLWLHQIRRDLRAYDAKVGFEAAAQRARGLHLGRQRKREHLRDGRRPLPEAD